MSKSILLSKGKIAIVSDEDFDYLVSLGTWTAGISGKIFYAYRTINFYSEGLHKTHKLWMHKVVAERVGLLKDGNQIDHIDRDSLNNCRDNLRLCNKSKNQANRLNVKRKNFDLPRGVYKDKGRPNYRSCIVVNSKKINLGSFSSASDAATAYNEAAVKYFGEFAKLNEIPDANR